MSNAFAPIVRARPNPIFGRPVHQGSPPIDYSPILLLKPFGFRIAPDTLSSDENLVGQRGITPAFGYSAPHPSAGGTLTLLIHALPSAHCEPLRHPSAPGLSLAGVRLIIPDHASGLPVLRALSLCTCCRHYPGAAAGRTPRSSHPAVSAFPGRVAGSACTSSFSRLAQRLLALRPAHSRGHQFVTRYPKASDISSPPCLLRLLPAGANRRVGLAPTGKRRLVTAHTQSGHSLCPWHHSRGFYWTFPECPIRRALGRRCQIRHTQFAAISGLAGYRLLNRRGFCAHGNLRSATKSRWTVRLRKACARSGAWARP